jgi:hypothetical protein
MEKVNYITKEVALNYFTALDHVAIAKELLKKDAPESSFEKMALIIKASAVVLCAGIFEQFKKAEYVPVKRFASAVGDKMAEVAMEGIMISFQPKTEESMAEHLRIMSFEITLLALLNKLSEEFPDVVATPPSIKEVFGDHDGQEG